jgi:hypothetical protein
MPSPKVVALPEVAPKPAAKPKKPAARKIVPKLSVSEQRTVGQGIAAVAAGFLPVASYIIAHHEVADSPVKWLLVIAALVFSAPTLAEWAERWCKGKWKAWGFTALLEGCMVFSSTEYLGYAGLAILVAINCHSAWALAGSKK